MLRKWVLLALTLILGVSVLQAHENESTVGYVLKADANGIQQVYQLPLDGSGEARQISHAASDVLTFGVAEDGLSVAYVNGGQLWLQPIHTEEAEALAGVTATQFFHQPVFSPDGQYMAYADNGVWLIDLGTREAKQLLADVKLDENAANANDFRLYAPEQFVMGSDDKAVKLVIDIGVWEWNTVGVLDLASGQLQELQGQVHTDLLPLSDGKVLLFGNTGVAGEPSLDIANSLDDINSYQEAVKFSSVTGATLFAEQAVEIEAGVVRVFGQSMGAFPDQVKTFILDYDLNTDIVSQVHMTFIQNDSQGLVDLGKLSPDGSVLPIIQDVQYTEAGTPYGTFSLVTLGPDTITPFSGTFGLFGWQP